MASAGCFGLHLGNSFASIAISKEGKTEVIANEAGDFVTPAIFSLQDDATTVVGLAAKHQIVRNSGACVINSTMLLNEETTDSLEDLSKFFCSEVDLKNSGFFFNLKRDGVEKAIKMETVTLEILSNMNSIANHALKADEHTAVLAVPLSFTVLARQKLAKIAASAGFEVLQIISEPAAAALAYNIRGDATPESVLIYRLGGVSKDVTLLRAENGLYEVLGNVHEKSGANSLDKILVDYIAKEFYQKYKLDPNESRRTIAKLYQHAQNAKHVLSSMGSAHIFVESLMDGVDFSHNLSRARFENCLSTSLVELIEPVKKVLNQTGITKVDKIILCGGGMRIPKFQTAISAMFPQAELLSSLNPEEVICIGCAKQAALLSKNWDPEYQHIDVEVSSLPFELVVKVDGEDILTVEHGTLVPFEKNFTVEKAAGTTKFNIFEKNLDNVTTQIGEVSLELEEIDELTLKIDTNGVQIVKASE